MAVSRVAVQASTAQLAALKLFADSNGLVIAHAGVFVGSFTRDISLANGTQAVTGVGFKPSGVILFATVSGDTEFSVGFGDGTNRDGIGRDKASNNYYQDTAQSIMIFPQTGVTEYKGYIISLDSDGFTVAWTKVGSPTGTATVMYLALR